MKSLSHYVHNVSDNTHLRGNRYREIYHAIDHIANGGQQTCNFNFTLSNYIKM